MTGLWEMCRVSDFSVPSPEPDQHGRTDLAAAKQKARSALLKARRSRSIAELRESDTQILEHLSAFLQKVRPKVIALYEPFGTEPGAHLPRPLPDYFTDPVAESTARLGVLVPILREDRDLNWRDWREPHGDRRIEEADVVIVPALGVDRNGIRLGRGGGSYDRALRRTGRDKIALLHDGELAHSLPAQPHDQRVSGVITPTAGLIRLPLGVDDGVGVMPLLALGDGECQE